MEYIYDEEQVQILDQISKANSFDKITRILINNPTKIALFKAKEILESVSIEREKENIIISWEWRKDSEIIKYKGPFLDNLNINIPNEFPIKFQNGSFYYYNRQIELK